MASVEYRPVNRRRGRRLYRGALYEPPPKPIPLPFTPEHLATVLRFGLDLTPAAHTHQAIAHWCSTAAQQWRNAESPKDLLADVALEVAEDVAAQWELSLSARPGGLASLHGVDADSVRLPDEWFRRWLGQVENQAE